MPNVITLEAIEEELTHEFAPLTIEAAGEQFVLRNLLRIDASERAAVMDTLRQLETQDTAESELDEAVLVPAAQSVFRRVVANGRGEALVTVLGDDLLRNLRVLQKWVEATQPGEVPNSPA